MLSFLFIFFTVITNIFAASDNQGRDRAVSYNTIVRRQSTAIDAQQVAAMLKSDQVPESLKPIIQDFKNVRSNAGRMPKAMMFCGKPGMGKSKLAQAIAISAGIEYIFVECPQLPTSYQSSGATNLAKAIQPALDDLDNPYIIILDELGALMNNKDESKNANNVSPDKAFLSLHDQVVRANPNVFFIGTTNEFEKFPDPVKSRFRKIFKIKEPSHKDRRVMINYLLSSPQLDVQYKDYHVTALANQTENFSCRDLEDVAQTAVSYASRRQPSGVGVPLMLKNVDITKALQEIKSDENFLLLHPTYLMSIKTFLTDNKAQIIPTLSLAIGLLALGYQIYSTRQQYTLSAESAEIAKKSFLLSTEGAKVAQKSLEVSQQGLMKQTASLAAQEEAAKPTLRKTLEHLLGQICYGFGASIGGGIIAKWLPWKDSGDQSKVLDTNLANQNQTP